MGPVRTLHTRQRFPPVPRGYTLIEMLLVIIIVGVLAGVAVMSFDMDRPQRTLGREAQRLQYVLAAAAEEALLQGVEYGLLLGEGQYRVVEFDAQAQQWRQSREPGFRQHRLPGSVDLVLEMEEQRFDPEQAGGDESRQGKRQGGTGQRDGGKPGMMPQVLMLSSGELTPFTIYLGEGNGAWAYRVTGDGIRGVRSEKTEDHGRAAE